MRNRFLFILFVFVCLYSYSDNTNLPPGVLIQTDGKYYRWSNYNSLIISYSSDVPNYSIAFTNKSSAISNSWYYYDYSISLRSKSYKNWTNIIN